MRGEEEKRYVIGAWRAHQASFDAAIGALEQDIVTRTDTCIKDEAHA